jgi:hypothetical protein
VCCQLVDKVSLQRSPAPGYSDAFPSLAAPQTAASRGRGARHAPGRDASNKHGAEPRLAVTRPDWADTRAVRDAIIAECAGLGYHGEGGNAAATTSPPPPAAIEAAVARVGAVFAASPLGIANLTLLLAGGLHALALSSLSLFHALALANRREEQAIAYHTAQATHGATGVPASAPEAAFVEVYRQEVVREAAGLTSVSALIRSSLAPALAVAQASLRWGPDLCDVASGGAANNAAEASIDTVVMDEAGCCADYTLPVVLSLQPANLVRLRAWHRALPPACLIASARGLRA